jgi:hypothetical protein
MRMVRNALGQNVAAHHTTPHKTRQQHRIPHTIVRGCTTQTSRLISIQNRNEHGFHILDGTSMRAALNFSNKHLEWSGKRNTFMTTDLLPPSLCLHLRVSGWGSCASGKAISKPSALALSSTLCYVLDALA